MRSNLFAALFLLILGSTFANGSNLVTTQVAPGTIFAFGGTTCPKGSIVADGSSELRTAYPALFAAIGTAWGTADGTHFNRPDLRGAFMRGRDNGLGRDPNSGSRTAINSGGATGDAVGSYQADMYASHSHGVPTYNAGVGDAVLGGFSGSPIGYVPNTQASGGSETRPKNAYVLFCVKF